MNARERLLHTLCSGNPDRVPYYDHKIREDVIEQWRREGLPTNVPVEHFFNLDRWDALTTREEPCLNVRPIPEFKGQLRTRADFKRLKAAYDPDSPGRYPREWNSLVRLWKERDYPVGIAAWRGMLLPLNVGGWFSLVDVMYGFRDHPALIDEMMEHVTHFMPLHISKERVTETLRLQLHAPVPYPPLSRISRTWSVPKWLLMQRGNPTGAPWFALATILIYLDSRSAMEEASVAFHPEACPGMGRPR